MTAQHFVKSYLMLAVGCLVLLAAMTNSRAEDSHVEERLKPMDETAGLFEAILEGNMELVEELIAKGADVNVRDKYYTPLYLATSFGHKEVAKLLKHHGAHE